jgi:hypothetical protein
MALEGTIRDFGLPDIFQLIGLQRKTGLLTLRNDQESVTVTFENGMVVMADSSAKRLEDRLGNVLVKQGKIPVERLEEALQLQRATLQRLGHILLAENFITADDLREALQVQVSQIVFKVFRWRDGDYHFAPTDQVDYDREHFSPMSADFILMEGIRMVDEWPIIEKKIPSMDIVFRAVVDPALIEVGGDDSGLDEAFGGITEGKRPATGPASHRIRLTPDEERTFRRVDGARTVQGIIDASGQGEFEVCRTLFDLLNRNIIAPVGRGTTYEVTGRAEESAPVSLLPAWMVACALIVVVALASWGHLSQPFRATARPDPLVPLREGALDWARATRLERLDRCIRAYQLATGQVPNTLGELADAGLIDRAGLMDPWGRPFHYALTARGYFVVALDEAGHPLPATQIEGTAR